MGLDKPIHEQYLSWAGNFFRGNFGESLWNKRSGWEEFKRRFPVTFQLATMTIVLASVWGIFVGIIAAIRQDSALDYALRSVSVIGLSVPYFWSSTLVIIFVVVQLVVGGNIHSAVRRQGGLLGEYAIDDSAGQSVRVRDRGAYRPHDSRYAAGGDAD